MPIGNLLHSMVEVLIISVNKKKLQLYEILRSFATLIEIFCFLVKKHNPWQRKKGSKTDMMMILLSISVQIIMSKYS